MSLLLTIVSPEKTLFKGEVDKVFVPGAMGTFEILEHHAPIISSLREGVICYNTDSLQKQEIKGGFVEVVKDKVLICVELK